jgi:signal transduction histidine kinase
MLVACEARFRESDLTSVIDQGECADEWKRLIEEGEPRRHVERASWSLGDRVREAVVSSVPLALALIAVSAIQADRLALVIEGRLSSSSEFAAEAGDASQCAAMIERWTAWADWVDLWQVPQATQNRDRHLGLSRLERCRGDLAAAAAHQGEALLAANRARSTLVATLASDPGSWLENELSLADLLHHAALVESDRNSFRNALLSLGQAEKRLARLSNQIQLWSEPEARAHARASIEEQQDELLTARSHVIASMSAR